MHISDMTNNHCCLNEVHSGTRVAVCHIDNHDNAMDRLQAMGMCVGRQIEVVRQGNPMVVLLLRARVGLSNHVARRIMVERRMK